jgi:outer membrane protein TolC
VKKLIVILAIFTAAVFAQSPKALKLDLNKSIELALKNNHDYKQAKLDYEKAEEQVKQAYGSALFPTIDGSISYNRTLKKQVITFETPFFSGTFPVGTDNTLTGGVNISQPIFRGAMFLAIKIAKTFADISSKSRDQSKLELIMQVKQAYYTHLVAKEFVKLAEVQLKRAEENLRNTESMFKAGLVSEYDLIKAKVQYKNALPMKTDALNQLKLSENNLNLIMGVELDTPLEAERGIKFQDADIPEFEDGLKTLYLQNKLLKQAELQTKMQDYNVSYEFSKHLPELNAFGNWLVQAQEDDPRSFSAWRYYNSISVGLTLKIPIFNGFATQSQVEQAEIDYKKSIEGLAKMKKTLRNEYESTVLQLQKTAEQIEAYKSAEEESEKGFNIAAKRFKAGLGTQIEVTGAMMEILNSKVNYLRSLLNYNVLAAQLDMLLGKSFNMMHN